MSQWLEEDEPVYVHPRDPYTRIHTLASSRHVRIELDQVVLAESAKPTILFETGLPPRYYLPPADVRLDLLRAAGTPHRLPVQGHRQLLFRRDHGKPYEDLVWTCRHPAAGSQKIAGLLCFYPSASTSISTASGTPAHPVQPTTHLVAAAVRSHTSVAASICTVF